MTKTAGGRATTGQNLLDFEARLTLFYREAYPSLLRSNLRYGSVDDVKDVIQDVFLRLYKRYAEGEHEEPDNLGAYFRTAIRNGMLDKVKVKPPLALNQVVVGGDGQPAAGTAADRDDDGGVAEPPIQDPAPSPADDLAWKQLLKTVFARLPDRKWVNVAAMVMNGASPEEIGRVYDQNGYVLRRYMRELVCRILKDLAGKGDPLADDFGRDLCGWPKKPA